MTYIIFAHKPVVRLARHVALIWRRLADAPLDSSTVRATRAPVPDRAHRYGSGRAGRGR
ncbi:hypothetical protein [Streptomyces sp. NPDC052114]|uniref:hypothetical protein n=1 Tax=unclassified Streptomyces TaxID=2593676 RepID=UPI00342FC10A